MCVFVCMCMAGAGNHVMHAFVLIHFAAATSDEVKESNTTPGHNHVGLIQPFTKFMISQDVPRTLMYG